MDSFHKVPPPLDGEDSASTTTTTSSVPKHDHISSYTSIPPRMSLSGSPLDLSTQHHNSSLLNSISPSSSLTAVSSQGSQGKQQQKTSPFTNNTAIPSAISSTARSAKRQPSGSSGLMQHQSLPTECPYPERYAEEQFTERVPWADEKERIIRGPFDYSSSHPGKDFRSQVISAFNTWLNVPKERLDIITKVVGMLHEASLLVDDVQDFSELRRGFPVAHSIFGVAQTINSANYIYFFALRELIPLNNPLAISTYAEELVNLHRGQGMDLFWRDTLTCPTEEDYLEMVGNKTGGLFRLGIKLMQAESSSEIDCVPLVDLVGLIFQIRDDYMNLNSKEYSNNKGMCEDLTEGKFSFPVIHSIRADPLNLQLINVLKQKTSDVQIKRYAVTYMESKGSFEYTRQVVSTLLTRARALVVDLESRFGQAPGLHKILDKMVIS